MDVETLAQRIVTEFGYKEQNAPLVAKKLLASTPQIYAVVEQWWQTHTLSAIAIEGYTLNRLMREHGMNPIAAMLTLDWLAREPEKAMSSLARGHDRVS